MKSINSLAASNDTSNTNLPIITTYKSNHVKADYVTNKFAQSYKLIYRLNWDYTWHLRQQRFS